MAGFTTSDGIEVFYLDEGDPAGLPVLCLPGLTRNETDFDHVAASLRDVRLIRMTFRGRGRSGRDGNFRNYSVPVEGRDTVELLDHLDIPRAAILGTSRGGIVAMYLAATRRDRLAGVALNDIGPVLESGGRENILGFLGRQPEETSIEELTAVLAERTPGFAGVPLERWEFLARNSVVESASGFRLNYDPKLRDAVLEQMRHAFDAWVWFDALEGLPLALLRGENSGLLSAGTAAEMRRRRPDMVFAEIPDRGHCPFLDEPESVAAIRRWLQRIR